MDLIKGRKRKYKLPIIIVSAIAVVLVSITASVIIYAKFFMGTGPVRGCEKKVIKIGDNSENYFICEKELFTFQVHEDIAYDLPYDYLGDLHRWFKNEVPYGPEITTFKSIRLTTWAAQYTGKVTAYAEYLPSQSHINIFYDSNGEAEMNDWRTFYKDYTLDRYDLRLWKYTIAHEYGHHATVRNMSNNLIGTRQNFGKLNDVDPNENGKKFFEENGFANYRQFNGYDMDEVPIEQNKAISRETNYYLWTRAEMMTRELQTYTNNGLETQKFDKDGKLVGYKGASFEDTIWRQHYNNLGYASETRGGAWIPTTLKENQKNISAIVNYVYGANDNPLHAIYYDSTVGYVLNTSSNTFSLTDSTGKEIKPSYSKEISNFWYNETFLDGNSRKNIDVERYAMTFKTLAPGVYNLNLKEENPRYPAMSLAENGTSVVYKQTNNERLATVRRGIGNQYTIEID